MAPATSLISSSITFPSFPLQSLVSVELFSHLRVFAIPSTWNILLLIFLMPGPLSSFTSQYKYHNLRKASSDHTM